MPDVILKDCAYLGGCNYPIAAGDSATLSFGLDGLLIWLVDGASFSVPYLELASIEVSGPGTLTVAADVKLTQRAGFHCPVGDEWWSSLRLRL